MIYEICIEKSEDNETKDRNNMYYNYRAYSPTLFQLRTGIELEAGEEVIWISPCMQEIDCCRFHYFYPYKEE